MKAVPIICLMLDLCDFDFLLSSYQNWEVDCNPVEQKNSVQLKGQIYLELIEKRIDLNTKGCGNSSDSFS